ncbi:type II toxin-antitoxin system PemK/MazF family toxin [Glycocaulis sp.]|uniref:type II toxin-antitoxin system PemK/MazF family toxin n=1 Tax=Glycocaulis sp. TaxID=1969725 RepID=UPI003D19BA92
MKRGDIVTVAMPGGFSKPRLALVLQADYFAQTSTATIALISSTLVEAPLLRITLEPSEENGLRARSQIMVDKVMSVRRERVGKIIGKADSDALLSVNRSLAVFLGFA